MRTAPSGNPGKNCSPYIDVSFGVSFFSSSYPAISFPFLQKKVPSPFPKLPAKTRPTSGSLKLGKDVPEAGKSREWMDKKHVAHCKEIFTSAGISV
jgi:hypothetical protein